ncbi:uncharacterized protein METZ01_LOCUS220793, partial [marine metagenome]
VGSNPTGGTIYSFIIFITGSKAL